MTADWEPRAPRYLLEEVEVQPAAPTTSEPRDVRNQLPPGLVQLFDVEWVSALEQAKATRDLADLYELVNKWHGMVRAAQRKPG